MPRAEVEKAVADKPEDFIAYLFLIWDKGEALSGPSDQLDNDLYPEWKPKKVVQDILP